MQTGERPVLCPAEVVEEVKRRVETTGRIEAGRAEISAINLEAAGIDEPVDIEDVDEADFSGIDNEE